MVAAMRRAAMLVAMAWALGGVGCGGKQVPQHSGYKGKKPTPWTKAKAIELDEELKAKVSGELDYGTYKRAKWFSLTPPGPGSVGPTAAEVFGLPTKGRVLPGYDADLVVFDPERTVTLAHAALHSNVDHATYEGMTVRGYPVATVCRGAVVVADGALEVEPGYGRPAPRGWR